jgi:hypothetical protein
MFIDCGNYMKLSLAPDERHVADSTSITSETFRSSGAICGPCTLSFRRALELYYVASQRFSHPFRKMIS